MGGLFWATSLEKFSAAGARDHLVPPRRMDAAVSCLGACYPFGREHGRKLLKFEGRAHAACRQPVRRRQRLLAAAEVGEYRADVIQAHREIGKERRLAPFARGAF